MDARPETDEVMVLETNLDDVSGEIIGDTLERLFQAGALDAWTQPIQMKKNRPGVLLSVLCEPEKAEGLATLILTHTTAFGVRQSTWSRWKLRRDFVEVSTAFGLVRVKCGYLGERRVQASPEYESCREVAERNGAPVRDVFAAALTAMTNS
jgi:uncharacterized protein (DUF111 family)